MDPGTFDFGKTRTVIGKSIDVGVHHYRQADAPASDHQVGQKSLFVSAS
jgi:hypothetical protein